MESFLESIGAAMAPLIVGLISDAFDLKIAFLAICIAAWLIYGLFLIFVAGVIPRDVARLRGQMRQRADHEREMQEAGRKLSSSLLPRSGRLRLDRPAPAAYVWIVLAESLRAAQTAELV
jgi:hypothetical protein